MSCPENNMSADVVYLALLMNVSALVGVALDSSRKRMYLNVFASVRGKGSLFALMHHLMYVHIAPTWRYNVDGAEE